MSQRLVFWGAVLGLVIPNLAIANITVPCTSVAGNLIANCNFETGDFTGWSLAGNNEFTGVAGPFDGIAPNSGNFQVVIGAVGSDALLSQTFATTAGALYAVSFYMAGLGGEPSNFTATFNSDTLLSLNPAPDQSYVLYSYKVVATDPSSTLTFAVQNDPNYQLLGDVSVVAATTPEPSFYVLLCGALLALFCAARRFKRPAIDLLS
jgi:hypothetical protein